MRTDRALAENGGLADYILLIVQIFQSKQQRVACIIVKCQLITALMNISELLYECIVILVKVCLQSVKLLIVTAVTLRFDQIAHSVAYRDQTDGAFCSRSILFNWNKIILCIFEHQSAVLHSIGERTQLFNRRVRLEHISGFGCRRFLCVRLEHIVLNERVRLEHILVTEVKNCCGEQIFQFDIRIGDAGGILTVLSCDLLHRTQNHFRVLQEIIVQLHAVCIFSGFRPCGQLLR